MQQKSMVITVAAMALLLCPMVWFASSSIPIPPSAVRVFVLPFRQQQQQNETQRQQDGGGEGQKETWSNDDDDGKGDFDFEQIIDTSLSLSKEVMAALEEEDEPSSPSVSKPTLGKETTEGQVLENDQPDSNTEDKPSAPTTPEEHDKKSSEDKATNLPSSSESASTKNEPAKSPQDKPSDPTTPDEHEKKPSEDKATSLPSSSESASTDQERAKNSPSDNTTKDKSEEEVKVETPKESHPELPDKEQIPEFPGRKCTGDVKWGNRNRLGNVLFQYAAARYCAERCNFQLSAPWDSPDEDTEMAERIGTLLRMPMFPKTALPKCENLTRWVVEYADFISATADPKNCEPAIIHLPHFAYPFSTDFVMPIRNRVRDVWFRDFFHTPFPNESVSTRPDDETIVVHLRLGDMAEAYKKGTGLDYPLNYTGAAEGVRDSMKAVVPLNFYEAVLTRPNRPWRKIWYIHSPQDREHPYLKALMEKFGGIAVTTKDPILAFVTLVRAKYLVMYPSTMTWWAAFLSNAVEVHFPIQGFLLRPELLVNLPQYIYYNLYYNQMALPYEKVVLPKWT